MKSLSLILIILLSSSLRSEMINLECKTQTQNSERTNTFSLLLGTETKKAVQILKKGQLTMDLSIRVDRSLRVDCFLRSTSQTNV